jgi:Lar family restriction alleviation protein
MELKPCPICGHQASIVYGLFDENKWGYTIKCHLCKKETTVKSTEEQAIIAWNNILWSNEKPKTSGVYNVLYSTDEGKFVTACYFDGTDTWYHDVGINHDRVCTDKVIMWQPLPEMPKDNSY